MEKMTFEQAIKRLEEIVDLLENNETSLDDSVELFQEGVQLSQYCSKKLGNVENKVSKILIDGQLEDFDVEVEMDPATAALLRAKVSAWQKAEQR